MMPAKRHPQRAAWVEEIITGLTDLAKDPNSCRMMLMESSRYADEEEKAMTRWMVAVIRVLQDPRPEAEKMTLIPTTLMTDLGSWR